MLRLLTGLCAGIAVSVPGVSAAVILFLFAVYEEIVAGLGKDFYRSFFSGKYKEIFQDQRFRSFLLLATGLCFSLFLFSPFLFRLLGTPVSRMHVYAFFLGCTLACARLIQKKIFSWKAHQFLFLALGLCCSLLAFPGVLSPGIHFSSLRAFLCGAAVVGGFLVPGLSPDPFYPVLGAEKLFSSQQFSPYIFLCLGTVAGWFLLSRGFSYALKNHREKTLSFFLGNLLGSVPLIWPFAPFIHHHFAPAKEDVSFFSNHQMVESFALILAGYLLSLWLHQWRRREKKPLKSY